MNQKIQESQNIVEHKHSEENNETGDAKKEAQEYVTPFLPEYLCESFDILYSPLSANELFMDTLKACDEMKATVLKQKRDKVKACLQREAQWVISCITSK